MLALVALAGAGALWLLVSERRRHQAVEAERARLSERIITAEADERRRLALFLHDGPVQNLSGIALMLDAAMHAIDGGSKDGGEILGSSLDRHRGTIRALRDLSFKIEPVVVGEQGFGAAVLELADQLGVEHHVQIDVDVDQASVLGEGEQVGLYQIIREALSQAVRRGPPSRISVVVREDEKGGIETLVTDDGERERRKGGLAALAERARPSTAVDRAARRPAPPYMRCCRRT